MRALRGVLAGILGLVLLSALSVLSPPAHAFRNEPGKAGRLMFNPKLGAAIGIPGDRVQHASTGDQLTLQLDFGVALDRQRSAYLLFPAQFQVGRTGYSMIMVPLGFQYDIPIRAVPGLYLYPRLTVGYAAFVLDGAGPVRGRTVDLGFVMPEFGAKYVLHRRWNFGFEPFGLPVFFNARQVALNYRLLFYAGVNF